MQQVSKTHSNIHTPTFEHDNKSCLNIYTKHSKVSYTKKRNFKSTKLQKIHLNIHTTTIGHARVG